MSYVYVGRLLGTHGIKGELKLKSSFKYLDRILAEDFCLYIGSSKTKVFLHSYRYHNGLYLLSFRDYLDINLVADFKNKDIYVLREDLNLNLEYVNEDYIGLDCYYKDSYIGKVIDIVDCGGNNNVFYIRNDSKEVLIPLNDKFVDKVLLNDRIIFKEVEGLLDAN